MMQGNSTNTGLYEIIINAGSVTSSPVIGSIQPNINAIGFRVADGYLYGIRRSDDHLIRIGSDGSQQDLGVIAGLPAGPTYNSGAFGPDGFLYALGPSSSSLQKIDIDTVSRVGTGGSSSANTPDIAIPDSDFAYGVIANGQAVRIPLAGGVGTPFGPDHNKIFGAAFSDTLGNVYLSDNATNDIYQLDLTTGGITLVGDADPDFTSSANDGVFCRTALFPTFDYSDTPTDGNTAPDGSSLTTYGQATHAVTPGIQLGDAIDGDSASIASNDASGDGGDDDGVNIPSLIQGQSATIDIDVAGASGYLQGWIDWNGDGDFLDTNEQIATDVQDDGNNGDTTANDSTINLPVTVPAGAITSADTFARFRWSTQVLDTTTSASNGEVEDYQVAISLPTSLPPRSCANGTDTFDWSTLTWPGGSLGPQQFTVGGVQYTVEVKNPNNHSFTNTSPKLGNNNFNQPALFYSADMTSATPGQYIEVHITMRDPATGTLLPVTGLQGIADDVDQQTTGGTWQDEVVITGYLGGTTGTAVLPTLVAFTPANVRVVGNVATGITTNNFPTGGGNGADVEYGFGNQAVDTLVVRYRPGPDLANPSSAQDTTLNSWSLCSQPVASNPNLLLVKRVTRVNGLTMNGSTDLNVYVDDPTYPDDDNTLTTSSDTENWPTPSTYLLGATNGGETRPGDEIEFTIYFLSTGTKAAADVQLCDKVPSFQTFVPDAFQSVPPAPSGGVGTNRGISVEYNGSVLSYTNDADGDTAQYYPPGSTLPDACANALAQAEDNGAIVVNLGTLPHATNSGTPSTSYGAVRFRAKVK